MDEELLARVEAANCEFATLIAAIPEAAAERPKLVGDWSAREVLSHIIAWSEETTAIITAVHAGTYQPRKYDFDQVNAAAVAKRQDHSWEALKHDLTTAQSALIHVARSLTDEQWQNPVVIGWLTDGIIEHNAEHAQILRQLLA